MPDTPWSLISGLLGICSVVLSAQGNILTFVFGFGQVATYTYLCVREQFYAEIALNIYYFVTMIYGVYVWKKRLQTDSSLQIQTRQLRGKSHAAHHAQGVIAEGHIGVERGADEAVLHVEQTIEGVGELTEALGIEAHGQGVDGEVAAVLVILKGTVLNNRVA